MMQSSFLQYTQRLKAFISASPANGSTTGTATAECDEQFNRLALELFALQFKHVAPFGQFCRARGASPGTVRHWREIPALPVGAFKEFEISGVPPEHRTTVFHSSGTTRQRPSRHFHTPQTLEVYESSLLPWFAKHLIPEGIQPTAADSDAGSVNRIKFLCLTPSATQAPRSSLAFMFDAIVKKLGDRESSFGGLTCADGSWTLDMESIRASLNSAGRMNRPVAILGTAFSFVQLIDALASERVCYRLPSGSRVLETGGYKGKTRALPKTELYALIERHLGIPDTHIVSEYGMSELSSQAYDRVASSASQRVFRFPPWSRVIIISPETGREASPGENGIVQIADLANAGSALMIRTEDLGVRSMTGDDFELAGRVTDAESRGCSLMISSPT